MFDFDYQLKILPEKPGVYIMKNSLGEVIYIGKAKILKNRVRQYFQKSKNHSQKVKSMVKNISEFEYIVTDSEMEALILECNLIKKYRPKYNILLKDDKHYPFIKVTVNEDFPRIIICRKLIKDGAKYFGPYTDGYAVKEIIELIRQIFPIRNCKKNIKETEIHTRPCLNYHIGLCKAPCAGYISKEKYRQIVNDIMQILSGKDKIMREYLLKEMEKASQELNFERAANMRDKIKYLNKIMEKQKIISGNFENEDFINLYKDEKDACVQVFFLRNGKIVGREHFILEDVSGEKDEYIIEDFIKQFYGGTAFIPKKVFVPECSNIELLSNWLSMKKEFKTEIKVPQKGEKKKLLRMVEKNAKITLEQFKFKIIKDKENEEKTLLELTNILNIDFIPERIEAYDISNIQGVDSVGSMVVFENGKPKNSDYRKFKINTVQGADDYGSMREILERRFQHGFKELNEIKENNIHFSKGKFCVFPDIIFMDGGKGQVNVAKDVLLKFNLNIPVCGMVKDNKHRTRGLIYEGIELPLKKGSRVLNLITRIQDEAHRFAISYHRSLRGKNSFFSILDDIKGIGPKRKKELLKKFGGIQKIKEATYNELIETPSMNKEAAENIINYFKEK